MIADWYKDGTRLLMLIKRPKDGGRGQTKESLRFISHDSNQFDTYSRHLSVVKDSLDPGWRIYSSVNSRDVKKAIHHFKHQELDEMLANNDFEFYKNIYNRFFSQLAKPQNRKEKYFLIDIDEDQMMHRESIFEDLHMVTKIIDHYDTPNGMHIITEPYNPRKTAHLEVKKDAMRLLET